MSKKSIFSLFFLVFATISLFSQQNYLKGYINYGVQYGIGNRYNEALYKLEGYQYNEIYQAQLGYQFQGKKNKIREISIGGQQGWWKHIGLPNDTEKDAGKFRSRTANIQAEFKRSVGSSEAAEKHRRYFGFFYNLAYAEGVFEAKAPGYYNERTESVTLRFGPILSGQLKISERMALEGVVQLGVYQACWNARNNSDPSLDAALQSSRGVQTRSGLETTVRVGLSYSL